MPGKAKKLIATHFTAVCAKISPSKIHHEVFVNGGSRGGFVCKMSLKAPFRSYESTDESYWPICCSLLDAESIGIVPRRLRCSVWPLFPNQTRVSKRSRACAYTSHLVIVPAGYTFFDTKVQLKGAKGVQLE